MGETIYINSHSSHGIHLIAQVHIIDVLTERET